MVGAMLLVRVAAFAATRRAASPSTSLQQDDATMTVRPFNTSYLIKDQRYEMIGHEPVGGTAHPVYIFLCGDQGRVEPDMAEERFTREMAERGFVAARVEYPGQRFLTNSSGNIPPDIPDAAARAARQLAMRCEGGDNSYHTVAKQVFGYDGTDAADAHNALATLCHRENADCHAGVAVHGHSLGGLLGGLVSRVAPVTAMLSWGSGSIMPGWDTCCGQNGNHSCCDNASGIVGGQPLLCEQDQQQSEFLARSRRRLVIGADDAYYGGSHPLYGGLANCRQRSGDDCGEANNCIQADGSGYYLPNNTEVGVQLDVVDIVRRAQSHIFYESALNALNPQFEQTDAEWGLRRNLDWLARTATAPDDAKAPRRYR